MTTAEDSASNVGKVPLRISEIFGHDVADHTPAAENDRKKKRCPFRDSRCTKGGKESPLGICSMGDDTAATTICPVRFLEGGRLFTDAGRVAFGSGRKIAVAPEMRILHVPRTGKRIGKIDFVIAALDSQGHATDFAALEVQSVYISGHSIRPAFNNYLATGQYSAVQRNRPDYRSSAQKRLMPQLSLKVPVFRRWGKKFFVVVDAAFFAAMPPIKEILAAENSEVTWLVYPLLRTTRGVGYTIGPPRIIFTQWDDVLSALREGEAPAQSDVLAEIETKLPRLQRFIT